VIVRRKVAGEDVRLCVLPRANRAAWNAWQAFVESDSIFGLDVESTAFSVLGPFDPSIKTRLIQFGNKHEAWVLDPANPAWRREIVRLLKRADKRFVSHNASFDTTRVRYEFGIDLGDRSIDTLPMASLRWPGITRPKDLKSLSTQYIDGQLAEAEDMLHARFMDLFTAQKPRTTRLLPLSFEPGVSLCRRPRGKAAEKCQEPSWTGSLTGYCYEHWLARKLTSEANVWGWSNIPLDDPMFTSYAGLDAIYVRRLLDILARELGDRGMNRLSKTEQRVKRQMTAVSFKGHRVDVEWTRAILDEVEAEFNEAEGNVEMMTGVKARSPKMKNWFIDQGIRVTSLDKDHVEALVADHGGRPGETVSDVLANLEVVSKHSNLLSNLRTIMLHATEGDGYVHPNINTLQAHTGRMSITGPAMQTLAKKGEKGTRLRGCFIARDGHVLIGADYDSQEIRIGAGASQDESLLEVIRTGKSQHVITAESIWPDEFVDKTANPDLYTYAKNLDFAQQYGAMPKKIAAMIGCSEREAVVLWGKWRRTYKGLVQWSDRLAKRPYVVNPFGRVIPRDEFRAYASGNYFIQSTGRDMLGEAMCRLEDAGWAPYFWLPIHDELAMEVPEDRAEEGCAALTEHMTTTILGVEVPAEGEIIGTRWKGLG
jgi:DNA polymerase-1